MSIFMRPITGNTWLNSKPLGESDFAGKVILTDFWTYSCVNCLRTLPYLKKWWEKYKDKDFLLVGIHTPEFEFERSFENVKKAVRDLGITWPIVLDNEYYNWNNFGNRYWPAHYLSDKTGKIIYEHVGEGNYGQTEELIRLLLGDAVKEISPATLASDLVVHQHGRVCVRPTPETYLGTLRGHIANEGGYLEYEKAHYHEPLVLPLDLVALNGEFTAWLEYVESAGRNASIVLSFKGTEVNLVMAPSEGEAAVEVMLNDRPVPEELRGKDIEPVDSIVLVKKPQLYNLIKSAKPLEGKLRVKFHEWNFRAYAFTFSGCID